MESVSQEQNNGFTNSLQKQIQAGGIRISYLEVNMPAEEANLGLMGFHSNVEFFNKLYAGIGLFSSVAGERGGLFTLGINTGFKQRLYHSLYLDVNLVFGGGGGGHSPVGGGAFINPKIGIYYNKSGILAGVHYSYFDFFSGDIASPGISYFIEIPLKLKFASYNKMNQYAINQGKEPYESWNESATVSTFICRFDNFFPFGSSEYTFGEKINKNLHLVGFEYEHFLKKNIFLFFHADGAYKGFRSGFMDFFVGAGVSFFSSRNFYMVPRIAFGGGGGGRIQTGGGLLIYPSLNLEQKISTNFSISENGGFLITPFGSFKALSAGISLKYNLCMGGTLNPFSGTALNSYHFFGLQFIIENQSYLKAALHYVAPENTQLLSLQINADIGKRFYIAGQTAFAYLGQSGGYAEGLFGIGIHSSPLLNDKLQFIFNGMTGIGGGGNIPTEQGFIIKPTGGIKYYLGDQIALYTSVGKIYSPFGKLNSWSFSGGVVYAFSVLTGR